MFARVVTTDVSPNGVDNVIRIVHEQLPEARQQPGYTGFYLLADREAGQLMTISLWDSRENILAVEARAAELNRQSVQSGDIVPPGVTVYEIVVQD